MFNKLQKNALHKRISGPKLALSRSVSNRLDWFIHSFRLTGRILVYTMAGRILA